MKCVPFGLQIAECSLPQAPLSVSEVLYIYQLYNNRLVYGLLSTCSTHIILQSLDGTVTLENGFLKATIKSGVLTSLVHKETGR